MMGREHALFGFGAYAISAWALAHNGTLAPELASPQALTCGALVSAGAALVPDIDNPNSTAANAGGPITRGIAYVTNVLSGGHRQGTHQLWFAAGFFLILWATTAGAETVAGALKMPALSTWHLAASCLWFTAIVAFGVQATTKTFLHEKFNRIWQKNTGIFAKAYTWGFALLACAGAWILCGTPDSWGWLVPAVITGHLSHLLTDALTAEGLAILPSKKIYFPILGEVSSTNPIQILVGTGTAIAGIAVIIATATGITPQLPDFNNLTIT